MTAHRVCQEIPRWRKVIRARFISHLTDSSGPLPIPKTVQRAGMWHERRVSIKTVTAAGTTRSMRLAAEILLTWLLDVAGSRPEPQLCAGLMLMLLRRNCRNVGKCRRRKHCWRFDRRLPFVDSQGAWQFQTARQKPLAGIAAQQPERFGKTIIALVVYLARWLRRSKRCTAIYAPIVSGGADEAARNSNKLVHRFGAAGEWGNNYWHSVCICVPRLSRSVCARR